jgi:hypothetical protein
MTQLDLFTDQPPDDPLTPAREAWRATIEADGGDCPCCGRWGKVYPRSINETMARSLIWLAKAPEDLPGGWVDVPERGPKWLLRSNQLSTLRWWGLIERRESEPDVDEKHSGMWRLTRLGVMFVTGRVEVPKVAHTYDGKVVRMGEKTINIRACFGRRFSYDEVMASPAA